MRPTQPNIGMGHNFPENFKMRQITLYMVPLINILELWVNYSTRKLK